MQSVSTGLHINTPIPTYWHGLQTRTLWNSQEKKTSVRQNAAERSAATTWDKRPLNKYLDWSFSWTSIHRSEHFYFAIFHTLYHCKVAGNCTVGCITLLTSLKNRCMSVSLMSFATPHVSAAKMCSSSVVGRFLASLLLQRCPSTESRPQAFR